MTATVEYLSANPVKVIRREFKSRDDAIGFLISVKGSNIIGYLDDGTFGIYIGRREECFPKL
jgi:hypothetical protein